MNFRRVAVILFTDLDGRVLMQDRRSISKLGEEWGFFGGGIEEGETPEQAVVREIKEELGYTVESFKPLGVFRFETPEFGREIHAYTTQLPSVAALKVREGDGMAFFSIEEAYRLKLFGLDWVILDALRRR
jgi:mutator protein MutT